MSPGGNQGRICRGKKPSQKNITYGTGNAVGPRKNRNDTKQGECDNQGQTGIIFRRKGVVLEGGVFVVTTKRKKTDASWGSGNAECSVVIDPRGFSKMGVRTEGLSRRVVETSD